MTTAEYNAALQDKDRARLAALQGRRQPAGLAAAQARKAAAEAAELAPFTVEKDGRAWLVKKDGAALDTFTRKADAVAWIRAEKARPADPAPEAAAADPDPVQDPAPAEAVAPDQVPAPADPAAELHPFTVEGPNVFGEYLIFKKGVKLALGSFTRKADAVAYIRKAQGRPADPVAAPEAAAADPDPVQDPAPAEAVAAPEAAAAPDPADAAALAAASAPDQLPAPDELQHLLDLLHGNKPADVLNMDPPARLACLPEKWQAGLAARLQQFTRIYTALYDADGAGAPLLTSDRRAALEAVWEMWQAVPITADYILCFTLYRGDMLTSDREIHAFIIACETCSRLEALTRAGRAVTLAELADAVRVS